MSRKVQRTLIANLEARPLAAGVWRLSSGNEGGVELILCPADVAESAALAQLRARDVVIVWDGAEALVTLGTVEGLRRIRARTVMLHEPQPALYEALPLVRLDAAAHRFWRRVFLLVRIPGGRRLLGLVARRAGGRG